MAITPEISIKFFFCLSLLFIIYLESFTLGLRAEGTNYTDVQNNKLVMVETTYE